MSEAVIWSPQLQQVLGGEISTAMEFGWDSVHVYKVMGTLTARNCGPLGNNEKQTKSLDVDSEWSDPQVITALLSLLHSHGSWMSLCNLRRLSLHQTNPLASGAMDVRCSCHVSFTPLALQLQWTGRGCLRCRHKYGYAWALVTYRGLGQFTFCSINSEYKLDQQFTQLIWPMQQPFSVISQ